MFEMYLYMLKLGSLKGMWPKDAKYCTMVAYSLGRLGVRGPVWQELSQSLEQQMDYLAPLDMALSLGRLPNESE